MGKYCNQVHCYCGLACRYCQLLASQDERGDIRDLGLLEYRNRFVCFKCRRCWKSKFDKWYVAHMQNSTINVFDRNTLSVIVPDELSDSDIKNRESYRKYYGTRCSGCGQTPMTVYEKFRPPRQSNIKSWNALESNLDVLTRYCPESEKKDAINYQLYHSVCLAKQYHQAFYNITPR